MAARVPGNVRTPPISTVAPPTQIVALLSRDPACGTVPLSVVAEHGGRLDPGHYLPKKKAR